MTKKDQKAALLRAVARPEPKPAPPPALSLEERKRRADRAMGVEPEAPTSVTQTPVRQTPVRSEAEPPSMTPVVTQTPVRQTEVRQTRVPQTGVTEIPVDERMWLNYPPVLNWVLDDFLPRFGHNEQGVLLRVLRLTLGFRRRNCLVSVGTIARKARLSEPTVNRAVASLKAAGIVTTSAVIGGKRDARGLEFTLTDRALPPADVVAEVERTPYTQTGVRGTGVPRRDMKSLKRTHEETPAADAPAVSLSELRTEAKRYRELHPSAPADVVKARLREYVKELGGRVNEAAIDEAVKG